MGIIRLILLVLIGYLIVRLMSKIFAPRKEKRTVYGQSKQNGRKQKTKDIEDADYEDIE